jgi:hypothetical protein
VFVQTIRQFREIRKTESVDHMYIVFKYEDNSRIKWHEIRCFKNFFQIHRNYIFFGH